MFVLFSVSLGCRKDGLRVMWLCGRYRRLDVSRAVYCVGGGGVVRCVGRRRRAWLTTLLAPTSTFSCIAKCCDMLATILGKDDLGCRFIR